MDNPITYGCEDCNHEFDTNDTVNLCPCCGSHRIHGVYYMPQPDEHQATRQTKNIHQDLENAVNIQSLECGVLIELQNGNAVVYWQMWGLQPAKRAVYLSMENQKEIEPRTEVPDDDYDEIARLAFSHPKFSGLYHSPLID